MQLIQSALNVGKTALLLVPEISLTAQTINRIISRFGKDDIAVLHSRLSIGERYDEWKKVYEKKAKIIVGTRSAIFAPTRNIGLVIIDEEHDMSYKSESTPKYDARDIAKYICKNNNCPLLLGSATPDLKTFYEAKEQEKIEILELTKRAHNAKLPTVDIIDLREELQNGNRTMISTRLYKEIEKNLNDNTQTILFLNRRGYSTYVICTECGATVKCKNCNINLTYHHGENILKCHYCGYTKKPIINCEECGSKNIKYSGTGTQKLEAEIQKMFPTATTIRMDVDTTTGKDSHEKILERFKNENINILIGTQMVVKGHHFPNVTLVGVILADNDLNMEDYRAHERTFQILTQVAGRAGRGEKEGRVIIQTYNPDNFSIIYSKEQNYEKFYNAEINIRKVLKYPPFCDIISFSITSTSEEEIERAVKFIYNDTIKVMGKNAIVYKPQPSPIDKIKNTYRWRIILKCRFGNNIINLVDIVLNDFRKNGNKFRHTNFNVDVNSNNMV